MTWRTRRASAASVRDLLRVPSAEQGAGLRAPSDQRGSKFTNATPARLR